MPNQPRTPARAVRISDELWDRARAEAALAGETVSDLVRDAVAHELDRRRAARRSHRRSSS